MKFTPVLFALTLVNLGLLAYPLVRRPDVPTPGDVPLLRGRGLEIVDDAGRLRAQLKVEPANTTFAMPDGTLGYPETVIFRLITPDGKPRVKLTTSGDGSGLMLLGSTDTTHAILQAEGAGTLLKLRNDESTQRILRAVD
jgi:hypothetical protein